MSDTQDSEHKASLYDDDASTTEKEESDSDSSDDESDCKRRRNRRKPKYSKETAMTAILRSRTEAGNILRSIGYAEGAPRAGRETVDEVWKLYNQTRPQSEIKRVMEVAAQLAVGSGKRTITSTHIKKANELILNIKAAA